EIWKQLRSRLDCRDRDAADYSDGAIDRWLVSGTFSSTFCLSWPISLPAGASEIPLTSGTIGAGPSTLSAISAPGGATSNSPEKPVPPVRMVPTISISPAAAEAVAGAAAGCAGAGAVTGAAGSCAAGSTGGTGAADTSSTAPTGSMRTWAPAWRSTARNFIAVAWSASFFSTTGLPLNIASTRAGSSLNSFARFCLTASGLAPATSSPLNTRLNRASLMPVIYGSLIAVSLKQACHPDKPQSLDL